MTKGFTVKANPPEVTNDGSSVEDLITRGRENLKGKTIVFCLPGRQVSYTFLKNFVQLCFDLVQNGTQIQIHLHRFKMFSAQKP